MATLTNFNRKVKRNMQHTKNIDYFWQLNNIPSICIIIDLQPFYTWIHVASILIIVATPSWLNSPPTWDQTFKCMSLWGHSHSNYHTHIHTHTHTYIWVACNALQSSMRAISLSHSQIGTVFPCRRHFWLSHWKGWGRSLLGLCGESVLRNAQQGFLWWRWL